MSAKDKSDSTSARDQFLQARDKQRQRELFMGRRIQVAAMLLASGHYEEVGALAGADALICKAMTKPIPQAAEKALGL